jgi:RNA polymerase sigma-70 factor (ECF subfamily)
VSEDPDRPAVLGALGAIRDGDSNAFADIVVLYQRRLFGLALMVTRDPSGAEEVAQDAFVRAFAHLDAYDQRRPFYPWLATIAVRLAQNWLVKHARIGPTQGLPAATEIGSVATPQADPLTQLITNEDDRALWRLVCALPRGERTAVILHYRHEMSVAEIASALGVTAGTVKTQLFRARKTLRTSLDGIVRGQDSND